MTRSECYAALRRGVRSPVRAALVLPVVAGAVLTTSAGAGGGAAVAEPGARAGGVRTTLAVAGNGILRSDGASSTAIGPGAGGDPSAAPEPTAGACEEDGARVVIGDGDDAEPVFDPGASPRIAGSAWCVDGRLAQGERTLRLRLVAVGGYAFRGTRTRRLLRVRHRRLAVLRRHQPVPDRRARRGPGRWLRVGAGRRAPGGGDRRCPRAADRSLCATER